jgi:hypothetical protein
MGLMVVGSVVLWVFKLRISDQLVNFHESNCTIEKIQINLTVDEYRTYCTINYPAFMRLEFQFRIVSFDYLLVLPLR